MIGRRRRRHDGGNLADMTDAPFPRLFGLRLILAVLAVPALAHGDRPASSCRSATARFRTRPRVGWIWACHVDPIGRGATATGRGSTRHTAPSTSPPRSRSRGSAHGRIGSGSRARRQTHVSRSTIFPATRPASFPIRAAIPPFATTPTRTARGARIFVIALPAHPRLAARAHCAPGAVGIMLTGVALFNALDAPGRDAVAHETQDRCHGHPQRGGVYHYHNLSNCIADKPGRRRQFAAGRLRARRLRHLRPLLARPAAHQRRSRRLPWHDQRDRLGRPKVKMYHYVATADFPYTVGCLRGDYDRSIMRRIGGPPPGPTWRSRSTRSRFLRASARPAGCGPPPFDGRRRADYFPRGALTSRTMIQIGMTITAPSRK